MISFNIYKPEKESDPHAIDAVSVSDPRQEDPVLLHRRVLVRNIVPPPHVTVQVKLFHSLQEDHAPSTVKMGV